MRVTILGCGGSAGVPAIGGADGKGDWGACDPAEPRNRRRRASILVEERVGEADMRLLVDTGPDLRAQLIDAGVAKLDAVLFTHDHADHVHGIDELRMVNRAVGGPIPVFADRKTLDAMAARFGYVFDPPDPSHGFYKPWLIANEIAGPFMAAGVNVTPIAQGHGIMSTLGFRFGRIAYSVDVKALDEEAFAALAGVETWIVDCYSWRLHPTHAHFSLVMDWIGRVKPRRAVLTHMPQTMDYREVARRCPDGVEPAYDGMAINA